MRSPTGRARLMTAAAGLGPARPEASRRPAESASDRIGRDARRAAARRPASRGRTPSALRRCGSRRRRPARADRRCQAVNCGCIGAWHVCPQKLRRLHPVQAAVPGQKNDDDVDGGERDDEERRPPDAGDPEIDDRPVGDGARIAQQRLRAVSHTPSGDQQQAHHEQRGNAPRTRPDPRTGWSSIPARTAITSVRNTTADDRRDHHAGDRERMASERFRASSRRSATSGSACRRRARRGPRPAGCRTSPASAASWSTWPSRVISVGCVIHWRMSSAVNFVPTPSSGLALAALAGDGVAHLALLRGVDLLSFLDLCRVLRRSRERA